MVKPRVQLKRWLEHEYDFTIIDCPPSIAIQVRFLLPVGDCFIVPSVPDRLSVRGSLYLMSRIKKTGVKIDPLGTLWSLYREQNAVHRRIIDQTNKRIEPLDRLPRPFSTVIPNAGPIAEAFEPDHNPRTFRGKYGPFAKKFEKLCGEGSEESEWMTRKAPEPALT